MLPAALDGVAFALTGKNVFARPNGHQVESLRRIVFDPDANAKAHRSNLQTTARGVVLCLLLLSEMAGPVAARDESSVHWAVARNREALEQIKSYHLKISQYAAPTLDDSERMVETYADEIWHSGVKHRSLSRIYWIVVGNGLQRVEEPNGKVSEMSVDADEVRNLHGWDPQHPFRLPLDFARNAKEFASVSASIGVRDPKVSVDRSKSWTLLWHVVPGFSLGQLAAVSELVEEPTLEPSIVRLRLVSSKEPALADYVGMLIDVDLEHDALVRRVEKTLPPDMHCVTEVVRFGRSATGKWLPTEIRGFLKGKEVTRIHVSDFSINEPIPQEELQVQFPEGSRVDDSINGAIHIWGKTRPEKTFTETAEFMKYLYAAAKERQAGKDHGFLSSRESLLLVLNLVIIILLCVLLAWRRRISRKVVCTNDVHTSNTMT